ncbi:MAG: lipid-A-disaccharide synthase [Acidobacteriota bacterium]|jgi:lipid-A-disaccharide synthase|nr:lipid-A-disaccharide synthase [Acidobacteriota bacterium]
MKQLLILAAENSAETYGVEVVRALRRRIPGIRLFGVGGERFRKLGVELIHHNREYAVVGVFEILSQLLRFHRRMRQLVREAVRRKADAALLIDYPDFNIRLARRLKKAGIPVYYYIAPTVWAWRPGRVRQLRRYTDHLFIIFPFEKQIFSDARVSHTYTGHPLLSMVHVRHPRERFRRSHGIGSRTQVVTLLPGSRSSEVERLLPAMRGAVEKLANDHDLAVFLLRAEHICPKRIESLLSGSTVKIRVLPQEERFDLINASDLALSTCGTSNLEIALLKVPFIAGYRVSPMTYRLRFLLRIQRYSIVNILADDNVIPELIQDEFTTENLVQKSLEILDQPQRAESMRLRLAEVTRSLSRDGDPADIIAARLASDLRHGD